MIRTLGSMPKSMPEGFFKAVEFPVLMRLDVATGDHRLFRSDGGTSRNLPLTISTKWKDAMGHDGAEPSGALFEVTFDPEAQTMSGRGFLADDELGRKTGFWLSTGIMRGNSADLADIAARYVEDLASDDYYVEFYKWALAKTTILSTPAFGDAYAKLSTDDEVMASIIGDDPMSPIVVRTETDPTVCYPGGPEPELLADGSPKAPHAHFFFPESPTPQKVIVHEDLSITGHLGLWESCHDGVDGSCVRIPRPQDGYASFNKPGVLTERGIVQTGPIFALGGHRSLLGRISAEEEAAAYGGIENSWADVRATEGALGPWLSGRVRPGVSEDTIYAARASRLSGHWKGGRLKAIVSVNSEGFDVPGTDDELVAAFEFAIDDEGVSELIASFPPCVDGEPKTFSNKFTTDELEALAATIAAKVREEPTEPQNLAEAVAMSRRRALSSLLLEEEAEG